MLVKIRHCGKQSLCAQGRGLVPEGPKAPDPLCSQPLCKMPPQLHATYTHHPADADITGAALWLPVRGGSLADQGSVCSMLTSFQVSSGEKETLELNGAKQHGLHLFSASQSVTCSVGSLENTAQEMPKEHHARLWEAQDNVDTDECVTNHRAQRGTSTKAELTTESSDRVRKYKFLVFLTFASNTTCLIIHLYNLVFSIGHLAAGSVFNIMACL